VRQCLADELQLYIDVYSWLEQEDERALEEYNQAPDTPALPKALNSEILATRPQGVYEKAQNRVTIKSDGITLEGTCATLFTSGLVLLRGLFVFKTPNAHKQLKPLTTSDTVPKISV
jgi:hypothetical protein